MSTTEELRAAVALLAGGRVIEFSRTLNLAIVGFRCGDVEKRLHAQCPFRVTYGDRVLCGSYDMSYAETGDPDTAFDEYRTMYDRNARKLTQLVTDGECFVESATLGSVGALSVKLTDNLVIEVFPACTGQRVEQWRLFDWHTDRHFVFPDSADR